MSRLVRLFNTSIGRKVSMALTGLVLTAFLAGHMLGNLKLFQGPEALNDYAAWLQGHPLLWVFRAGMLAIIGLHLVAGVQVAWRNRRSRPRRYVRETSVQVGLPARHMLLTGILVLVFVVYHILHLTVGVIDPVNMALVEPGGRPDVYARVVAGFRDPWISGTYLLGLALLGLHLSHAIRSMLQTLGFSHESFQPVLRRLPAVLTLLILLGFAAAPLAVLVGWVVPAGT